MIWYPTLQFLPRSSNQIQNHSMNECLFWQNTFQSFHNNNNNRKYNAQSWSDAVLAPSRKWSRIEIPFCISRRKTFSLSIELNSLLFTRIWIITRRIILVQKKKNSKKKKYSGEFELNPEPGDYDYVASFNTFCLQSWPFDFIIIYHLGFIFMSIYLLEAFEWVRFEIEFRQKYQINIQFSISVVVAIIGEWISRNVERQN